jgi:hypothetical protein
MPSQPPQPPEIERKLQFYRFQKIGIPLILLLPILALIGLFGESVAAENASNPQLMVEVEYPTRFRYKMVDSINVSVENTSTQPLSVVSVRFDRPYIESFSTVTFTPQVKTVTAADYIVELTDLQPQEVRIIAVEIQAENYWQHEGTITAVSDNNESVTLALNTFVFP